jgi:hypothetical protein
MMRFTIRDMLWLTVVVALAVAWSLNYFQMLRYTEQVERERDQQIAQTAQLRATANAYLRRIEQIRMTQKP